MSQTRAIEGGYSGGLRTLPLPGRVGDAEAGILRGANVVDRTDNPLSTTDAARGITGQSRQTDFAFSIAQRENSAATDAIVQLSQAVGQPYANRGGVGLSDEVVGFLLSANEVVDGQALQTSELSGGGALQTYQDAAASFPRIQDSLFSLAA